MIKLERVPCKPWPVTSRRLNQIFHAVKLLWYVVHNWACIGWYEPG